MLGLTINLNAVGISAANAAGLSAARDQLKATLPRGSGNGDSAATASAAASDTKTRTPGAQTLTPDQQQKVEQLKEIDRKVHAHEQAHLAAGGSIVRGGASYTYTYGPDGKPYATGGEVGIDTSKEDKAQKNIDKGQLIQRAALAPQDPSAQDYRVASVGEGLEATGRSDLAREQAAARAAQLQAGEHPQAAPAAATPGQNSSDIGNIAKNAYATVAAGPAGAGRVSVYA